jgi:hypothetical protein
LRVLCSKELRDLLLHCEIELASFDNRAHRVASNGELAQHR